MRPLPTTFLAPLTSYPNFSKMADATTTSPIYLPVTATAPDLLGIATISPIYGPGAYLAWLLTLLGTLYRMWVGHKSGIDPNLWLFMLVTNIAAINLLSHWNQFEAGWQADLASDAWKKEAGPVAAGMTVVFWGFAAIIPQLLAIAWTIGNKLPKDSDSEADVKEGEKSEGDRESVRQLPRILVLIGGSLLPLIAMCVVFVGVVRRELGDAVSPWPYDQIPFLYTPGAMTGATSRAVIALFFLAVPALAMAVLVPSYGFALGVWEGVKPRYPDGSPLRKRLDTLAEWMETGVQWAAMALVCAFGVYPLLLLVSLPIIYFAVPLDRPPVPTDDSSVKCFYMPCTAYAITDTDQTFALLTGWLTLVTEVGMHRLRVGSAKKKVEAKEKEEAELAKQTQGYEIAKEHEDGTLDMTPIVRTQSGLERMEKRKMVRMDSDEKDV
ncbi:uncharacterized protein BDZ99DRAFT_43957 [Mytilinidion resinicola]|uniref:Uncharacterized protein n=1 Tax=Mytilinidion resinicola TaxID=574789 RepID=A0A6A6YM32_9PEZI|nr:uncharacterized protein BDZ99DRAFT_43957 [Mytilinidion resinicola]KAF2809035.1 hypothetical protein BDZ99DRAFT_43957 [Mytilinidion resinicola]